MARAVGRCRARRRGVGAGAGGCASRSRRQQPDCALPAIQPSASPHTEPSLSFPHPDPDLAMHQGPSSTAAGATLGGEESARALVGALLGRGGSNPTVRCRPFSHLPRLTPNQASLPPIPTLTSPCTRAHPQLPSSTLGPSRWVAWPSSALPPSGTLQWRWSCSKRRLCG